MKKLLLFLLLIAASFQGFSQTPGISYQAVILNPNIKELPGANAQTSILANRNVAIRFTIINESSQQEYQEYHQTNTDAYGMINLLIGHGTRIGASHFEDILWNGLSKKLKIEIDFSGIGNNYTLLSEQELTFMPQPALGQDAQGILDNRASILAEVTRATNAESVIQTNVDANEAASILADDILQTNIDNVQADVDANEISTQTALELKANLNSPTFTGTPLVPTATVGTNTTQIATTAFVTNAVNSTVAGNFVDLTTAQTIVGVKTFDKDVIVNGINIGRGIGNNDQNTAVGREALGTGTGTRNTAIGYAALKDYAGTSFDNNTSVGYFNMQSLTTGYGNTSVGAESMIYLLTGSSNTSIGNHSLINTSGNNNVGVGKSSGSTITTGSNNTIIGTDANVLTNDQTNSTAVGFEAVANVSNSIQLGNNNVTLVNTSGSITSVGVITGASIVKAGGTSSQFLMADGSVSTSAAAVREIADEYSAIASQTSFTLTQTPSINSKVKMYVNGVRISNAAYSVIGTTLTYNPANNGGYDLTVGDRIQMDFYY